MYDETNRTATNEPPGRPKTLSRSAFLARAAGLAAPLLLAACGGRVAAGGLPAPQQQAAAPADASTAPADAGGTSAATASTDQAATPAQTLEPTEAHEDPDDPTPAQTEGPYFKPNSPERTSLIEAGMAGTKMALTGRVLATDGRPVARALLDFWQADAGGNYDNRGYTLRGHQYANDAGQYHLETVVPGLYPGRTRHIHVKVQAPNGPVLTTQLYFAGEARNASDSIFNSKLVLSLQDAGDGNKTATFDFVINVA